MLVNVAFKGTNFLIQLRIHRWAKYQKRFHPLLPWREEDHFLDWDVLGKDLLVVAANKN